jgi:hypothetical protein
MSYLSNNVSKKWKRYEVNCEKLGIGLLHLPSVEQPPGYLEENFGGRFSE